MQNSPLPSIIAGLQFTVHGHAENLWYAVKSPGSRYLRFGRREYLIASALDGKRTAEEVSHAVNELDSCVGVTPEDVLKVVSWLGKIGLLQNPTGSISNPPKQPFSFNPIYTKLPLLGGDKLERFGAIVAPLIGWPAWVIAGGLWLAAGSGVLANWELFATATSQLFVADSFVWWGLAWLLLKSVHELGHAVMAVRVGSQIRSAGISLIFMAPVPYVDLSDLWAIPSRFQRILCCAGGMLFELTVASIAALIAISTENQSLQYFCCAIATMGTVTTLAFNASPLIRFDGYFVLSDLINYPNLYTDAQAASRQFVFKLLRPWRPTESRMTVGLVLYGLACYQYRVVMMLSLAVGTILALQGVGLALVAWGGYAVIVGPFLKARAAKRLAAKINGKQPGGLWNWESALTAAVVGALCTLFYAVPAPIQPSAPGIVTWRDPQVVRAATDGFLTEVFESSDCQVQAGQVIAKLSNPELESELALLQNEVATIRETIALRRAQGHLAELQAKQAKLNSLSMQLSLLENKVQGLEVRSSVAGRLVQNDLHRSLGMFIRAGEPLAMLAQPHQFDVVASVDQLDVDNMRASVGQTLAASISGGSTFRGLLEKVEPRASDRLSETTLAAIYGGPIAVHVEKSGDGEDVLKTTKPRFEMKLSLTPDLASELVPGQTVWVKLPGHCASLLDAFHRWVCEKWDAIVQQSKPIG